MNPQCLRDDPDVWFICIPDMKYFLTIAACFGLCVSYCQKIDSLELTLAKQADDDTIKVDILNELGYEYWIVNPIQSIIYGQEAKALADILEYPKGVAFANRVIGVANWARGSYDNSLTYLFEGLEQYRSLKDSLGEGNCLMNIGLVYADRFDYDRAQLFYFEALQIFEALKASGRSGTTYTKIASIFIDIGRLDVAEDFLERALIIHDAASFEYGKMEVYNRLGLLNQAKNRPDSALIYLKRSLDISESINDVEGKTKTLLDLAEVNLSLNNLSEAERYLKEALDFAIKIGSYKWLRDIYENLQVVNRRNGDLNKAIFYYDQYIQVRDSIFNEQIINNISQLEAQLATVEQKRQIEAREQRIVILEQQTDLQRTRIFILVIAIALIISLAALLVRTRQAVARRKEAKAREVAEKARQEVEFKNRELSSYTVNFVQKNRLFEELSESIKEIKEQSEPALKKKLSSVERIVNKHIRVDEDWKDFKLRFENVHSGFFERLHEKFPSLTNNDLRLSVLVKMNFSIKEIGEMFGISPESVKTARYRLKKKLNLPSEQNLNDFLNEIS